MRLNCLRICQNLFNKSLPYATSNSVTEFCEWWDEKQQYFKKSGINPFDGGTGAITADLTFSEGLKKFFGVDAKDL